MLTRMLHGLFEGSLRFSHAQFCHAANRPERVQRLNLQRLLKRNVRSAFGEEHGFESITSAEDFQRRVPLTRYGDYAPWIERIGAGETGVLTVERTLCLMPTSGSGGARKLIPWTASLAREFQSALFPWLADLYRNYPAIRQGRMYWSITPPGTSEQETSAIPVGFASDAAYFGRLRMPLLAGLVLAPSSVDPGDDLNAFRRETLIALLRRRDLACISVWSPTFLTRLIDPLWEAGGSIIDEMAGDSRSPPDVRRANEVRAAFESGGSPGDRLERIWPNLALISCWGDAASEWFLPELCALFPRTSIQRKGLLATEGVTSLPWSNAAGASGDDTPHVLAARSHFYEFLPSDGRVDGCLMAHQLDPGMVCEVVLTTGGGLYRYRTGDLVRVTGRWRQLPVIKFLGRSENASDLCGEKLNEPFVRECLELLWQQARAQPGIQMLAPETLAGSAPCYVLFAAIPPEQAGALSEAAIAERLDVLLRRAYHYDHCRKLGQLRPCRVILMRREGAAKQMEDIYISSCLARGQRLGDVKPPLLERRTGWSRAFESLMA